MNSMASAISKALDLGLTPALMDLVQWPKTYGATPEEFMREFERQQSERSLRPSNQYECDK